MRAWLRILTAALAGLLAGVLAPVLAGAPATARADGTGPGPDPTPSVTQVVVISLDGLTPRALTRLGERRHSRAAPDDAGRRLDAQRAHAPTS